MAPLVLPSPESLKIASMPVVCAVIIALFGFIPNKPMFRALKDSWDDLLTGRYVDKQIKQRMADSSQVSYKIEGKGKL